MNSFLLRAGVFLRKGGLILNSGYTRVYAPVLRSPLLFHQNSTLSVPTYYATRPMATSSDTGLHLTYPSPYNRQSQYTVQSPKLLNPQSHPYYSALPGPTFPSSVPFSSYSVPNATYVPTVASNGLALILIATLILVALDLVIVRPQKSRSEVRSSMSDYCPLNC